MGWTRTPPCGPRWPWRKGGTRGWWCFLSLSPSFLHLFFSFVLSCLRGCSLVYEWHHIAPWVGGLPAWTRGHTGSQLGGATKGRRHMRPGRELQPHGHGPSRANSLQEGILSTAPPSCRQQPTRQRCLLHRATPLPLAPDFRSLPPPCLQRAATTRCTGWCFSVALRQPPPDSAPSRGLFPRLPLLPPDPPRGGRNVLRRDNHVIRLPGRWRRRRRGVRPRQRRRRVPGGRVCFRAGEEGRVGQGGGGVGIGGRRGRTRGGGARRQRGERAV